MRTAAQCGQCHTEIYAEWNASMHGRAMDDRLFLELAPVNKEECIRCHAPVPLREADFETPIARLDTREDAVSCLTCHKSGDHVSGPYDGLSGACRPTKDEDQQNPVKMCFGCHNQHDTGTEWLNGPYGPHAQEPRERPETSCVECHMPVVERPLVVGGPVRKVHRHVWIGGHDLDHVRKAADIDVQPEPLEGGGWRFRVFVTNVGAGHNIPTDARHRSFDTYVKIWDADGRVVLDPLDFTQQSRAHAATYRKFYRNEGLRDTQIPPLTRVSGLEAEKGYVDVPEVRAGRGEAWLVYRLTPSDMLEEESITKPDAFKAYRARLVKRVSFTFGTDK
jgi:nitrate/TMAO reductase-like tetraheme cytochrome c subunit